MSGHNSDNIFRRLLVKQGGSKGKWYELGSGKKMVCIR